MSALIGVFLIGIFVGLALAVFLAKVYIGIDQ